MQFNKFKCISEVYDKNGNAIGYRLEDSFGEIQVFDAVDVKRLMAEGRIDVTNLKLIEGEIEVLDDIGGALER